MNEPFDDNGQLFGGELPATRALEIAVPNGVHVVSLRLNGRIRADCDTDLSLLLNGHASGYRSYCSTDAGLLDEACESNGIRLGGSLSEDADFLVHLEVVTRFGAVKTVTGSSTFAHVSGRLIGYHFHGALPVHEKIKALAIALAGDVGRLEGVWYEATHHRE